MSDSYSLLILPGDGIGPEVMAEVVKVIDWFGANRGMSFDISEGLVGGASYDAQGTVGRRAGSGRRPRPVSLWWWQHRRWWD